MKSAMFLCRRRAFHLLPKAPVTVSLGAPVSDCHTAAHTPDCLSETGSCSVRARRHRRQSEAGRADARPTVPMPSTSPLGRLLLFPIRHRGATAQADLQVLRSRDALVRGDRAHQPRPGAVRRRCLPPRSSGAAASAAAGAARSSTSPGRSAGPPRSPRAARPPAAADRGRRPDHLTHLHSPSRTRPASRRTGQWGPPGAGAAEPRCGTAAASEGGGRGAAPGARALHPGPRRRPDSDLRRWGLDAERGRRSVPSSRREATGGAAARPLEAAVYGRCATRTRPRLRSRQHAPTAAEDATSRRLVPTRTS